MWFQSLLGEEEHEAKNQRQSETNRMGIKKEIEEREQERVYALMEVCLTSIFEIPSYVNLLIPFVFEASVICILFICNQGVLNNQHKNQ